MEDVELSMPAARYAAPRPPTPTDYHYGFGASSNSMSTIAEAPQAVERAAYTSRNQEPASSKVTVIALRDGSAYLAADYWVTGGVMHFISSNGEGRLLPLGRIDLAQTVRVNQERKVDFVLQSPNPEGSQ